MRFLTLSPKAQEYHRELEKRRMSPRHHVEKIVALSEIYGLETGGQSHRGRILFQAFSCEYIANLANSARGTCPNPERCI